MTEHWRSTLENLPKFRAIFLSKHKKTLLHATSQVYSIPCNPKFGLSYLSISILSIVTIIVHLYTISAISIALIMITWFLWFSIKIKLQPEILPNRKESISHKQNGNYPPQYISLPHILYITTPFSIFIQFIHISLELNR